jgi:putative ABC transport system permease protein
MKDLVYALRIIRKSPGFTVAVVAVLALGIGTNCAMFSLIDAVLLRALPFQNPQELAILWEHPPGYAHNSVAPLNFLDWSEQNHAFSSIAAISGGSKTLIAPTGTPERIPGQSVTVGFFDVLGVKPLLGRSFTSEDARLQAKVAVISESLWRSKFGSDPNLLGKTLTLDDEAFTVIGVAPAEVQLFYRSDLWTIFYPKRSPEQRRMHYLLVAGRLKPGITFDQASSDMAAIANGVAAISPETNKGWGVTVEPLRRAIVGSDLRVTSLSLGGAVVFVLLIACANVASLLLARGVGRSREMAVRAALGGSRRRIVSQLLVENVSLACLAGLAGSAIAWMIISAAPSFLPIGTLPPGMQLRFDGPALAFALVASLITAILFGLVPALQAARVPPFTVLRSAGNAVSGSSRFRAALAAGEIALSVALVAGAGLLLRTLGALAQVDPGFHADRVLTMHVSLPRKRYRTAGEALRFYQALEQEIAAAPGVRSVGFVYSLPLDGWEIGQSFAVGGRPVPQESEWPAAHYQMINADYFRTLGIEFQQGRAFTAQDTASSAQVCIINEELARRYFKDRDAVGSTLTVEAMDLGGPKPVRREIVGVVRQVKIDGLGEAKNEPEIYVPITQNAWFESAIAVATSGDPMALAPTVKRAIAYVDKQQPVTRVRTMNEVAAATVAQPRFRAELLSAFASWSVVLAAFGLFSMLAFSVSQRGKEFGIRMAVGATWVTFFVWSSKGDCGLRLPASPSACLPP